MVPGSASIWTRATNRANAGVWRLPLPRNVRSRISQHVYRNPPMPADRVAETTTALKSASVRAVVIGGWGIDALVGRQERPHLDLDLLVEHEKVEKALATLRDLGYAEWYRLDPSPMGGLDFVGQTVSLRDSALRAVDLHPVRMKGCEEEIVHGTIGGSEVSCISAREQIRVQADAAHKRSRRDRRTILTNLENARRAAAGVQQH